MPVHTTRRLFLSGLAALTAAPSALAQAPAASLRPQARVEGLRRARGGDPQALLAQSGFSGAVGWAVADIASGKVLESVNGRLALPPASVAKSLTALYALETLGSRHRFRTRLLAAGPVEGGILKGDLILAGGGDPALSTDGLAILAQRLRETGIHEVTGAFLVWDAALPYARSIDPEQPDQVGYSPAVCGIALNYNRVHFEWKRAGTGGYAVTMDARTERYRPDVTTARMRVVDRGLPVYTYEDADARDNWTVSSRALGTGGARWLPVRRPADYAGDVFRSLARSNGIVLAPAQATHVVPADAREVTGLDSADLGTILRGMLKYSNNLTAEMVGMSATALRLGAPPVSLQASAAAMSDWAARRFEMAQTRLVDHSGLSDASRMSAEDLVGALVAAHGEGTLARLLKPIAMKDEQGRALKSSEVTVRAKTGTLNFVSGLGGYVKASDGSDLAFAIFSADDAKRAGIAREDRESPAGGKGWAGRSRAFQQKLLRRWSAIYTG